MYVYVHMCGGDVVGMWWGCMYVYVHMCGGDVVTVWWGDMCVCVCGPMSGGGACVCAHVW